MKNFNIILTAFLLLFGFTQDAVSQEYILLGWNDLGMHCANRDFSKIGVLPPYNNVYAQLIKKVQGNLPQVITAGVTIEYSIPYNTYSVGKTNFWTYAQALFNLPAPLPPNIGLTGKGLSGYLDTSGNFFVAEGIPVTPFKDTNWVIEKPFQLIHLTARLNGNVVKTTDCVIPVSNEIGCVQSGCHASEQSIINNHEQVPGFNTPPILCARCHGSPILGTTGDTVEAKLFSFRIHEKHNFIQPVMGISTCYKCHPGPTVQCLRDVMSTLIQNPLICQNCHGTMEQVAASVEMGGRTPWFDEPRCGNVMCHGSNFSEEPGKLFRKSKGHGGLFCSACHSSPHAILPSREANDNLQNITYQGESGTLRKCLVCHSYPPPGPGPHGILYVGIKQVNSEVPESFRLFNNYPNPFNPVTVIKFDVAEVSYTRMVIYDAAGKEIDELVNSRLNPGSYEAKWDASKFTSGIYFCRLMSGKHSASLKMVLIK